MDHSTEESTVRNGSGIWRAALLLLGSFVFGLNLHKVLHELGHAVSVWVQAGSIHGLVLHPFLSCYTPSTYVPNHLLLYSGGALFGGSFAALLILPAWFCRSSYLMPMVMTPAAGLLMTSRWMLVSPFSTAVTDYTDLIRLGIDPALIFGWGLVLLVIGLAAFVRSQPLLGTTEQTGYLKRATILVLGVLPYQLASCGWVFAAENANPTRFIQPVASWGLALVLLAGFSAVLQRHCALFRNVRQHPIAARHLIGVWSAASALLVTMMIIAMPRHA